MAEGEARFDPRNIMDQRGPLVEEVPDFSIKPADINTRQYFFDAFGNTETEISAGYIVGMCQEMGAWKPFTDEDIEAYYQKKSRHKGFSFNQLVQSERRRSAVSGGYAVGGGWIVKKNDGMYHLTTTFVEAAFRSSPAPIPA